MRLQAARHYIALGILLFWGLVAQVTYSSFWIYQEATHSRHADFPFFTAAYSSIIQGVPFSYHSTGLRSGDDVVALNGVRLLGLLQLDRIRVLAKPGETLRVTVQRPGETGEITIPVRLHPAGTNWTPVLALGVFLPLSCLFMGFYIALARPRDPLAWITLAMLVSVGQLAVGPAPWSISSPWREILGVYHGLLGNTWPVWLVLFALYFPVPFEAWRRRSYWNWIIALPFAAFAALNLYCGFLAGTHLRELAPLARFWLSIEPAIKVVFTIYVTSFFVLLGAKQHLARSPDARRRLQVMAWGCTAALLPLLPLVFLKPPRWIATICLLMLILFPVTIGYVIVVQRAMDVRMVVRSGVRYAFAKNGIAILRILLITSLVILTVQLEQHSPYRWEGVLIGAAGVALIIAVGRLVRRVRGWMDRRFFREAYNAEIILTELGSSVAGIRDVKQLLQTVAQRIADSLHVERIAFLVERGQLFRPAYALGFPGDLPVELDRETTTVRQLLLARSPQKVFFNDPQSWVHAAPEHEQTALQTLDAQVLLPVALNNRLLGVISLSGKKSEVPYSHADLQLLSAVASQTGLALENAELTESIRREIAQRERVDRELEIAREVQQRLFPQKLPLVQGLEFAGYCRPALGVGGDYYDFLRLPDGCLGIAIGDVSGKGIAAALMMASLQASLRGQTLKPCDTLAETIQHVNQLVYDASADNRYATFFYAEYEPPTRTLRYVNAGHNAPVLYRSAVSGSSGPDIFRLEEGGTVLGLFADAVYIEASIVLEPGDVLVAFTDGISEAMNHSEEEFEEERLIRAVRGNGGGAASDLVSEILAEVDSFTAGARQHDDMTLVVVRAQQLM